MIPDHQITVSDVLRAEFVKKRVRRRDVHSGLGVSEQYVSMMLNGSCTMPWDVFVYLCGAVNLSPKKLRQEFPNDFNPNGSIIAKDGGRGTGKKVSAATM